jgi:hypothetical protein
MAGGAAAVAASSAAVAEGAADVAAGLAVFTSALKSGGRAPGPSGRVSTEKYLEKRWDKATFPSVAKSVEYHVAKHGKGLTAVQYTQRAEAAFEHPSAIKTLTKDIQGRNALKVESDLGKGLFTPNGKIIWFHPKL